MNYKLMLGCEAGMAPFIVANLGDSRYGGTPQPELHLAFPSTATWREVAAVVHHYAACINLRTPTDERWLVQTEVGEHGGMVYLELAEGTEREAEAGMKLLEEVTL
jgi:hypothetical protein